MTKNAAKFKPVKNNGSQKWIKQQQEDLPTLEETFENAKQAFILTLETSIEIAKRVDNLMNIRDYALKFWGGNLENNNIFGSSERVKYFKQLQAVSIATYEQLLEATKKFALDEFTKDEMKDYYEGIIPPIDDIKSEQNMCTAGLIFLTVKPFGEKMTALHHTILDEKKQREFMEAE